MTNVSMQIQIKVMIMFCIENPNVLSERDFVIKTHDFNHRGNLTLTKVKLIFKSTFKP